MKSIRYSPVPFVAIVFLGVAAAFAAPSAGTDGQETSSKPEAVSLLGRPLYATPASGEELAKLEKELADARASRRARPNDPEALIALGRRLAALWRYNEAIEVYTNGIMRWSNNAMLFRHRGHRFISIREFEKAVLDLVK
ncbi:MAG: hypothetical protein FJY83_11690, partial [Candidatus Aminicenantes bacterium]|nr:hypothetical protein [Candidatus Aminicenantes bacterium]